MSAPPEVNRRIIEALLKAELPRAGDRRLLLVHGIYDASSAHEFGLKIQEAVRRIKVTNQPSVLGIVEVWQAHQSTADNDDVLVVTTGVDDSQLGWDLLAYAVGRSTRTVDRAEIVKQRFGSVDIDPRIRKEAWLTDALLDAEPAVGWRRTGAVLTRDAAVRALIGARLGGQELAEGSLDMGALLTWSLTSAGPTQFAALPEAERAGLTGWLAESVGGAAVVLMSLAATGRAGDAMSLGVLASAVSQLDVAQAAVAFGSLLGLLPKNGELRQFSDAVEGTLERWIAEAESTNSEGSVARNKVFDVVHRADELAAKADLTAALGSSRFLRSSFDTRVRGLAEVLSPRSRAAAESALSSLKDHALSRLFPDRILAATMAVRLTRWLAEPERTVESVALGVQAQLADWGWVDRALAVLWAGDVVHDPVVGQAYRSVHDATRARRDLLDEAFAKSLAMWTTQASTQTPAGCLLIEDVLERIALPLVSKEHMPLILVLDGMSSAVAIELGEQLAVRAWDEASPQPGRRTAAAAAIPSVTRVSRACLLTAGIATGDQTTEKDGFAAFWGKHRKQGDLFHKGEIGGHAGHRLAEPLVTALAGDGAVAVVLNTIDDALDHGREGDRIGWRIEDITYLRELLDAARAYGRPVVLVADHGHVLDRSLPGDGPVVAPGVESARWRVGNPEAGEITLAGPRVLYGDGRVVVPWREDIRYTPRKAGYHGGASLAEMTVPVLVLLPSVSLLPSGWEVLPRESIGPAWWDGQQERRDVPASRRKPTKAKARVDEDATPLFSVTATLGEQVVDSTVYAAQRAFVRRPPAEVQAVIDALVKSDGTRSVTAIAAIAGRAGRNPDFLVITLQRLLNVEGYPVLSLVDGGRTLRLDVELLREQFRVGKS